MVTLNCWRLVKLGRTDWERFRWRAARLTGAGGQVVRWSGGQVVRWSGGQVVRWSGG